jgi:hypothetical protein
MDPAVSVIAKARLQTLVGITFFDTFNTRATLATPYTSIEQDYSTTQRITLGQPARYRELGSFVVVIGVQSGLGLTQATTISEQVRNLFFEYISGLFSVLSVGSIIAVAPDDGNYFQVKVPVEYQFDFFKP